MSGVGRCCRTSQLFSAVIMADVRSAQEAHILTWELTLMTRRQRQQILSQIIMDVLDVWIPATNLGYSTLNDGIVGAFG